MTAQRRRRLSDELDGPEPETPAADVGDVPTPSRSSRTTRPKFAQIRPDQQSGLDDLARDLQDARTVKSERITANTLIRVALDGLLRHSDVLSGNNEAELRAAWFALLDSAKSGGKKS